jgi:hypothetical protein
MTLLCKLHSPRSAPAIGGALRANLQINPLTCAASRRPWLATVIRAIIRGVALAYPWACVIGMRIIKPSVDSGTDGFGDDRVSKRTFIATASAILCLVPPSSRPDHFNAINITVGQSFHNPNKYFRFFRRITGEIR